MTRERPAAPAAPDCLSTLDPAETTFQLARLEPGGAVAECVELTREEYTALQGHLAGCQRQGQRLHRDMKRLMILAGVGWSGLTLLTAWEVVR